MFQHVGNRQSHCTGTECFRGDGDRGPCPGNTFGLTALVGALRDQHERYPCGECTQIGTRAAVAHDEVDAIEKFGIGPKSVEGNRVAINRESAGDAVTPSATRIPCPFAVSSRMSGVSSSGLVKMVPKVTPAEGSAS